MRFFLNSSITVVISLNKYIYYQLKIRVQTNNLSWDSYDNGFSPIGEVQVTQSCPALCDPIDYTVHQILQARILEWVAFPFSRTSSQPRGQTQVSHIAGRFFTNWATREAQEYWSG